MPRGRLLAIALLVLTGLTAVPASAAVGPDCWIPYATGSEITLRTDKPLDLWLNCTNGETPGDDFGLEVTDPPSHGTARTPTWDPSMETFVLPYDPDDGYLGVDQLTLTASDQDGVSELVVDIRIVPNTAPACSVPHVRRGDPVYWHTRVAEPQTAIMECFDPDLQEWFDLDPHVVKEPEHGTLAVETYLGDDYYIKASVTYTPDPGFTGNDSFVAGASDGALSDQATFHVTVADGLWCTDADPLRVDAGNAVTTDTYCSDPDFGSHSIEVVDAPSKGTTTIDGRRIHYTADVEAGGHDSFTFRATSPTGDSNVVTQLVEVVPNAAPVCEPMNRRVTSDSAATFVLRCADAEEDETILAVDQGPEHGVLSAIEDGQVTYTPDLGFVGVDRFTYVGSDDARTSAPATVRITVDDGKAPVLELHVARGQSPRKVARNGLGVYESSDEQVTATTEITVSRRTAKRLGLVRRGSGPVRIAHNRSRFEWDVPVIAQIHLTDRATTAIRTAHRVPITVRFRGVDPLGNVAQVTRRVTLRR